MERLEGKVDAVTTPAGLLPKPDDLDVDGLDIPENDLKAVISYSPREWADELPRIRQWLQSLGDKTPAEMNDELWLIAEAMARHGL